MNRFHLAAAMIGLASPASAEIDLPYLQQAETRYGAVSIVPADLEGIEGQGLAFKGTPVEGAADAFADIRAVLPDPDGSETDLVLLSLANGGNGCPMNWTIVAVGPEGADPGDQFGTCSESILDLREEGGTLVIDLASFEPALELVRFTYAAGKVSSAGIPRTDEGAVAAGPGDQVTRWIGRHPMMPFEDAGERLRFQTIMTEDQVYDLAARVTVASDALESDGFVIGEGFDPNSGGDIAGMWGIRIEDGAPFAIFRDTGAEPQVFGLSEVDAPNVIRQADLPPAAQAFLAGPQE